MKSAALLLFFQQPNRNYILFAILFCKSTPTNRVGEISAFAEISTSHTTVRTVPYCYSAFYLLQNHATFKQIKKRHSINYSDGFYIGLLYAVPLVLS